jgi:hypothetical protein
MNKKSIEFKKNMDTNPNIIGYLMYQEIGKTFIGVTNPCKIPVEIIERNLKEFKKQKPKEGQVVFYGTLIMPFNFRRKVKVENRKELCLNKIREVKI